MKDVLVAFAAIALSLGVTAGVVFGLHDEGTFISPPEIVAEEFVRALGHGRVAPARSLLASDVERATSSADALTMSAGLRARVGHMEHVTGRITGRSADTTVVGVNVEGRRSDAEVLVMLARENGNWRVTQFPGVDRPLERAPGSGARDR